MSWKIIDFTTVLATPFVKVTKNEVELPDGGKIDDFYTVTIPDAALIVAVTPDHHLLLKKEYRLACRSDVIECPAGMVEKGEEPLQTAKRELLEETGYISDNWTYLGPTWESTSKLTNTMHLFLAIDCVQASTQRLDRNERIDVFSVPLSEAVEMVMDSRINANSTAHAILKAAHFN